MNSKYCLIFEVLELTNDQKQKQMKTIKIRKGEYKATIGNMSVLIVKDEIHGGWNSYDADTDDWMGSADTKQNWLSRLKISLNARMARTNIRTRGIQ